MTTNYIIPAVEGWIGMQTAALILPHQLFSRHPSIREAAMVSYPPKIAQNPNLGVMVAAIDPREEHFSIAQGFLQELHGHPPE